MRLSCVHALVRLSRPPLLVVISAGSLLFLNNILLDHFTDPTFTTLLAALADLYGVLSEGSKSAKSAAPPLGTAGHVLLHADQVRRDAGCRGAGRQRADEGKVAGPVVTGYHSGRSGERNAVTYEAISELGPGLEELVSL